MSGSQTESKCERENERESARDRGSEGGREGGLTCEVLEIDARRSAVDECLRSLCADLIRVESTSITAAGSSTKDCAVEGFLPTVTVKVETSMVTGEDPAAAVLAEVPATRFKYSNIGSSDESSPMASTKSGSLLLAFIVAIA